MALYYNTPLRRFCVVKVKRIWRYWRQSILTSIINTVTTDLLCIFINQRGAIYWQYAQSGITLHYDVTLILDIKYNMSSF